MGGGSGSNSGNSEASPDSVNGLKFGQKIYFENAGSSSGSGAPARKGGQQQPPRCQVEGCRVDLSDAKAYYSRHKVCAIHSKSSTVVVAGLVQRFCQQCSRFHQLPEFDQEKRSCRRRLAGHNERRRKPPQGLSSRYSRLSSTVFDNSRSGGGFLVDFSAYSRHNGRDAWQALRSSDQNMAIGGRSIPSPWLMSSTQNSPPPPLSNLYLQGSGIPSGECFTGISLADSTCALSLLSNQASGLGVSHSANAQGAPMARSTALIAADVTQFPNPNWGFKSSNEASSSSQEMSPNLGLSEIAHPLNNHFSSDLELSQQNVRPYMAFDHSRAYDSSTHHIHWSL